MSTANQRIDGPPFTKHHGAGRRWMVCDAVTPRIVLMILIVGLTGGLMLSGCTDEKMASRERLEIRQKQQLQERVPSSQPSDKAPARDESDQMSRTKQQKPAAASEQRKKKSASKSAATVDSKQRRPQKPDRVAEPAAKKRQVSAAEKSRERIRQLFSDSGAVFSHIAVAEVDHRLTWEQLHRLVEQTAAVGQTTRKQRERALEWLTYLEEKSRTLIQLFQLPYRLQSPVTSHSLEFIREADALVTPVQQSMWRHCKSHFENRYPDLTVSLQFGYRSPAYQALILSRYPGKLDRVLVMEAPPRYSYHQRAEPDLTVAINRRDRRKSSALEIGSSLVAVCKPFGFFKRDLSDTGLRAELGFIGRHVLYRSTRNNRIIPEALKTDFFKAIDRTGFFPSPEGMRVLFALGAQESTLSWNPRLNRKKKAELRNRFDQVLGNIENSIGGALSRLFFSGELNHEKEQLIAELKRITDPDNRRIREYDFYLWTRSVERFLNRLLNENQRLTKFGEWLYEIERFASQIRYEPQTFGIWQINVNHLIERIEEYPQLRRRFPEIFSRKNDGWEVERNRMIDVLSGVPQSVLDRQRTLELIIHTYLQPRYQNHFLGDENDLLYFVAENVAGDLSTFRAAIQQELNQGTNSRLILDGDLSFYHPYSTRIDWSRRSNTQKALFNFIDRRFAYFSRPVDPWKLVVLICEADSWEKLNESELYRRIMRKKRGLRIFPHITSTLYQQTPKAYATIVMKKSRLF